MANENLTIVFTDMEGYTNRTSGLSRDQMDTLLSIHDRITATAVKEYGGKIVKNLGDGYMITFQSPTNAILCAKKIQQEIAVYNTGVPQEEQFWVRIAANSGEVSVREGDVFGEAVNVASRLMASTEAGDIAFTEAVYLAMNKTEIPTTPAGTKVLRGIPEAVRIYRVPRIGEKAKTRGLDEDTVNAGKRNARAKKAFFAALALSVLLVYSYLGAMRLGWIQGDLASAGSDVLGVEEASGSAEPNPVSNFFNRLLGRTPTPTQASGTQTTGGSTTGGSSTSGGSTGGGTGNGTSNGTGNGTGGGSTITPTPRPGGGNSGGTTPITCPPGYAPNPGGQCKPIDPTAAPTQPPAPTNTPAPPEPSPPCPPGQAYNPGGVCKPIEDTSGGGGGGGNNNQNSPNNNPNN